MRNSLILKGCFFLLFFSMASWGFCRQKIEYDSFAGSWTYVSTDTSSDPMVGLSGEDLKYDPSSGTWYYNNGKPAVLNNQAPANPCILLSNGTAVLISAVEVSAGTQKPVFVSQEAGENNYPGQPELPQTLISFLGNFSK